MERRHRTVLVTGASSGIGRAVALHLARRGDGVVLVSRAEQVLKEVRDECVALGGRAVVAAADVSDADAVAAAFDTAERELGPVDGVVHSAAVITYGRFVDVPPEVFEATQRTNVVGTANVAREVLLRHGHDGRPVDVVVVGSLLGRIAVPYMGGYVSSKWAVHGLVRVLQLEARRAPGVTFSLVAPGGVDTPVYLQAGTYGSSHGRPPPPVDSPEKVARAVVRSLDHPRRDRNVGALNLFETLGFRLLPGVYDRAVTPLIELLGLSGPELADSAGNVLEPVPDGEAVHGRWGRQWLRPVGLAVGVASAAAVAARSRLPRLP